ncbi:MAG: ankyrin repeat domain-containing protein [Verrucomicrobia bacterium]|nr:ankyrin repeat domain-containing protein [Verrucomicrobiota bacterium]
MSSTSSCSSSTGMPGILVLAVEQGEIEKLVENKELAQQWINAQQEGKTLLYRAADKGHLLVCHLLLEWKADPNRLSGDENCAALHVAAERGNTDLATIIRLHIEDEDVNVRSGYGATPLHHAARGGHVAMMRWLLDQGADRMIRNNSNLLPSDIAQAFGHHEVIALLTAAQVQTGEQPTGPSVPRQSPFAGVPDPSEYLRNIFPPGCVRKNWKKFAAGIVGLAVIGGGIYLMYPGGAMACVGYVKDAATPWVKPWAEPLFHTLMKVGQIKEAVWGAFILVGISSHLWSSSESESNSSSTSSSSTSSTAATPETGSSSSSTPPQPGLQEVPSSWWPSACQIL